MQRSAATQVISHVYYLENCFYVPESTSGCFPILCKAHKCAYENSKFQRESVKGGRQPKTIPGDIEHSLEALQVRRAHKCINVEEELLLEGRALEVWSWPPSPLCSDPNQNSPAAPNASNLLHGTSLQPQLLHSNESELAIDRVSHDIAVTISCKQQLCALVPQVQGVLPAEREGPQYSPEAAISESFECVGGSGSPASVPHPDVRSGRGIINQDSLIFHKSGQCGRSLVVMMSALQC